MYFVLELHISEVGLLLILHQKFAIGNTERKFKIDRDQKWDYFCYFIKINVESFTTGNRGRKLERQVIRNV